MAAPTPRSSKKRNQGRHCRRDTDRVVRWLQAGAVVTGVGAAVISGQGTAWASTDSDTGAADSSDTTSSPDTGAPGDHGGDTETNTAPEPDSEQDDEQDEESGELEAPDPEEPDTAVEESDADDKPAVGRKTTKKSSSPRASVQRATEVQTFSTAAETDTLASAAAFTAAPAPSTADIEASDTVLRPPTAVVTVTQVNPPQVSGPRPIRQLALGIFRFFGYNPNAGPGAPAPNPLLDALWGLYRRVESALDNQRPTVQNVTVSKTELTDEGDVIVTGAIDFDDADGDPLTYKAKNGTHGTVTVNPGGTFTYTPSDPGYTGTDTFTITANDSGRHVHGLFGIFGAGHTRTAVVTITLTAAPNDGPVITVDSDPGTGNSWTLDVDATDPDDDPVTVTVTPVNTGKVTVTPVDGQPGKYAVTVTDPAWAKANPGRQLSVNVSATDGVETTATTVVVGTVNNAVGIGANADGQIDIPALPPGVIYTQVSAGDEHTMLLRSDGNVIIVGRDDQSDVPDLPPGVTYTKVVAGLYHSVLLRSDGAAVSIGNLSDGQDVFPPLPPGVTYVDAAAGDGFTVLVRSDGTAVGAGENFYSQATPPPLPPGVTYVAVEAGDNHTVLLRSDGTAVGFGSPIKYGQIYLPDLPPGVTYTQVAAGDIYSALLRSDGWVVYSGTSIHIPDLPEGVRYTGIAGGEHHTVLLRSDGTAVEVGELADDDLVIPDLPSGVGYIQAAAGGAHTVLLSRANIAPLPNFDALEGIENSPLVISPNTLLANDFDPDGDPLTITAVWGAENGITALGADGTITYTPNANFHGLDMFQYLASDGSTGSAISVSVTVAAGS